MITTSPTFVVRSAHTLAIPLLGVLAAVQGSAPNIAATALVGASRGLDMVGGDQALAASMQTLAIAASVITTGLLADRIGRRRMLIAALVTGLVGQLIVAAAPMPLVYILGQAVTGVGLGAVYAAAFAYIQVLAAPGRLPAAVATFAACSGAAGVLFTFSGVCSPASTGASRSCSFPCCRRCASPPSSCSCRPSHPPSPRSAMWAGRSPSSPGWSFSCSACRSSPRR
jgi:MFS family permease